MSIIDSSLIRLALASNPSLRANLRELVLRLSPGAFNDAEMLKIERELVGALRLAEVRLMPTQMPARNMPLRLTENQIKTLSSTVTRFRDTKLRTKCQDTLSKAVSTGKIVSVKS